VTSVERHAVAVGERHLALLLHIPPVTRPVACVVCCHGLHASKDSDKYVLLAQELTEAGLAVARFDFGGCGESSGIEEQTTIATRLDDVTAVLERLAGHPRLDPRRGLLGSSLGGYVALHLASLRADVRAVVTWNAPAELSDLASRNLHERPGIGEAFVVEYRTGRYAKAPYGIARHLVIHSDADEVVPLDHGVTLHAQAIDPHDLVVLTGGDHRLSDVALRREAVVRSVAWFVRFL
jgi:pimeloyl-ACP methyl ester carboxylesterase